jgi:predicted TIM-barrel fold metal-dependent hydrolase
MRIDVNTYVGHWPFRQLRHNTTEALVRRLDECCIDRAVVASIDGILYKNVHPANETLSAQTRPFRDRLIPFATLNPTYPGWREDLRRCAEELELSGLRLYPQYHGYRLDDPDGLALVDAATELGWAIQVPMRIVDRRQRHRWDLAEDLAPEALYAALAQRPQARWMLLNSLGLDGTRLGRGRYLVEISRMTAVLQRNIQAMIERAGPEHLAFGTGMPFKVPEPAMLKLEVLDVPPEVVEGIAWRNAYVMLGLRSEGTALAGG